LVSGKETTIWDSEAAGNFTLLGWEPIYEEARGTYWVTTTTTDFTAYGIIDADGDSNFATYRATSSINPDSPITGEDVY
jgi:hypothetical protein